MYQREVKIKVLRQNFIKKHQINPEYFTAQEHRGWDQLQFCDRQLFYSKKAKDIQQIRPVSSIFNSSTHIKSRSIPTMATLLPEETLIKRQIPNQKKGLAIHNRVEDTKAKKHKMSLQSNFLKVQKIKKRTFSTNQQNSLPKYAVYIMKPCNVSPVKMLQRPVTALTHFKKELPKDSKPIKQRSASEKVHKKTSVLQFQPWETDQNEF